VYTCHSQEQKRWFLMRAMPLRWHGARRYVIAHQNITAQKLAEEKVKVLSLQDELTGVANRRHLNQFLTREWARAIRRDIPISLLMLDIDYFKPYNDNYGHQKGDQVLQQVARALGNFSRRGGDLVARFGGEEFAVVLVDTTAPASEFLAESIRQAIYRLGIEHTHSQIDSRLTISIGAATMVPAAGLHKNLLVRAADQALYDAKSKGRNRVVAVTPSHEEAWGLQSDRKLADREG
jgi:diguanylate cyclase (GGDEF)-like protein